MGWLDNIWKKGEAGQPAPGGQPGKEPTAAPVPFAGPEGIRFGRYGDNNKSYAQMLQLSKSEDLFRQKEYAAAFAALFDYLRDEQEDTVFFEPSGASFTFRLVQGSAMVHGSCDGALITARTSLVLMEQPSRAVMRRLLDLNFTLYYTHCALDENKTLCMLFNSPVATAYPYKLVSGLRELATRADRQDDLLLADFPALKPADTGHMEPLPPAELEVKYSYFRKWIGEGLERVAQLNPDSFSGAIAYYLLALLCRIDFLIIPEAGLQADLERIHAAYWNKKDEITLVERNQMMKEELRRLAEGTQEAFAAGVYRSRGTFSPLPLPKTEQIRETINGANRDAAANLEKKYPDLALVINEYGVLYNHYQYNMPQVLTDLAVIYMVVMHGDFCKALGQQDVLYNPETKTFERERIVAAIDAAIARNRDKYVSLSWDEKRLQWEDLFAFGKSFSEVMAGLNLETKRLNG